MKKFLLITGLAASMVFVSGIVTPVSAQKHGKHVMGMGTTNCMMQGMSDSEKKSAKEMMAKMSPAERRVMAKRCSMCMKDPHTALKGMDMKDVTEEMAMQHMMSSLTKSEQKTMTAMMERMNAEDKALMHKMVMNCCMYGMKQAK